MLADDIAKIAAREARAADTFVALRPNGSMDPERLVEGVLFGSGRHLFLFPETERPRIAFDRILLAWNGSRELTRAMAEGMPFLQKATEITVVVVSDNRLSEQDAVMGAGAVNHLKHHGVDAVLHRVKRRNSDVAAALIAQAKRRKSRRYRYGWVLSSSATGVAARRGDLQSDARVSGTYRYGSLEPRRRATFCQSTALFCVSTAAKRRALRQKCRYLRARRLKQWSCRCLRQSQMNWSRCLSGPGLSTCSA